MAILHVGLLASGLAIAQIATAAAQPNSPASRRPCPTASQENELLANASSLLQQNRFSDAITLLQAQAQSRCDERCDLLLAAAFDGEGDTPSAIRTLRRALALHPSNTSLATSLARDELREGDLAAAKSAIAQCRPTLQTPQRELRMIAMVYLENQDLPHADEIAQLAWRADPSQENLLFAANVLQLEGRYMDVVSLLEKHRHDDGDSPAFLITIGESESDGKLYAPAERDLNRAVALAPDSYPAHYVLGNLLVATGNLAGGIAEYQKAIAIDPQQPRTYYQLGRALEQQNDTDQAQRDFQQAIAVDSNYAPAYTEIGKLELRAGQLQPAVENLTRAIAINPALQDSYYQLVQAYARLGEREKSQAVMDQWNAYKKAHPLRRAGTRPEAPGGAPDTDSTSPKTPPQ